MTYMLVSSAKKLLGKSMYIFIVHTLNDSLHSNYNYDRVGLSHRVLRPATTPKT